MNQWSKITIKNQTLDCKGYVMNRRKKENSLLYGQTLISAEGKFCAQQDIP